MAISRIPGHSLSPDLDRQGVDLDFTTDGNSLVRLDFTNFRLGINQATPLETLHVVGNVLVSDTLLGEANLSQNLGTATTWWNNVYSNTAVVTSVVSATIEGTLLTSSQPNVTGLGNLTVLNVDGLLTAGNISTGNVSGYVITGNQPYITNLADVVVDNLTVFGNLQTSGNIVTEIVYAEEIYEANTRVITANSNIEITGDAVGYGTYSNIAIELIDTGVIAGIYGSGDDEFVDSIPKITVDSKGRITNIANVTLTQVGNVTFIDTTVSTVSNITISPQSGYIFANNSIVSDVADPVSPQDVVTLSYLNSQLGSSANLIVVDDSSLILFDDGVNPGRLDLTLDSNLAARISAALTEINSLAVNIGNLQFSGNSISSPGNITLDAQGTGIVQISGADAFGLPYGNTTTRPTDAEEGYFRYNTDLNDIEWWTGNTWRNTTTILVSEIITPDGFSNSYVISQSVESAEALLVVINGTVQQPTSAYTVTGNVVTFAETPTITDIIEVRTLTQNFATITTTAVSISQGNSAVIPNGVDVVITGNLVPTANLVYSLGNITHQWQDIWVSGNTIHIGGVPLTVVNGVLNVDGSEINTNASSYSNAKVASYLAAHDGNITAANIAVSGNVSAAYLIGNGSLLTGLPAGYANTNVSAYLPTYSGSVGTDVSISSSLLVTGNVIAEQFISNSAGTGTLSATTNLDLSANAAVRIVGGGVLRLPQLSTTARDALVSANGDVIYNTTLEKFQTYENGTWANVVEIASPYGNTNVAAYLSSYNGTIGGNIIIGHNLTVTGNLNIVGNTVNFNTNNLTVNDSIVELHYHGGNLYTGDDGRDIGLRYHYYKSGNNDNAFLGWNNGTGYLEWYGSGVTESNTATITGNYGTFKTGNLELTGTANIAGDLRAAQLGLGKNPTETLDVYGISDATINISSAVNNNYFYYGCDYGSLQIGGDYAGLNLAGQVTSAYLQLAGPTETSINIRTSNSSPNSYSYVSGGRIATAGAQIRFINENANVFATARSALAFFTSNSISYQTERLRITSDGDVGIGNSNPSHTLSVTGNTNVSGNITTGGILTDNYFYANGAAVSFGGGGGGGTSISNGTSNVAVLSSGGNVTIAVGGNIAANIGATTAWFSGNIVVDNITTRGTANTGNITGINNLSAVSINASGNIGLTENSVIDFGNTLSSTTTVKKANIAMTASNGQYFAVYSPFSVQLTQFGAYRASFAGYGMYLTDFTSVYANVSIDSSGIVYGNATVNTKITNTSISTSGNLDVAGITTIGQTTERFTSSSTGGSLYTITYQPVGFGNTAVHYLSSMASNITLQFSNVPTANNLSHTFTLVINQGATPYIANAATINGSTQTIKWLGAATGSGTANNVNVQSFTLMRTAGTWTVLSSITAYG